MRTVTLPLVAPAIVSATAFSIIIAWGLFAVPAILGMLATGSAARFAVWASVGFILATAASGVVAIVALTRYDDEAYVKELLGAGASAYVLKQSSFSELLRAIRAAAHGNRYLDATLAAREAGRAAQQTADEALRAQDVGQYPGKILRVTRDGRGLATNPFYDGNPLSIRSRVWSLGLRNPFRIAIDPASGRLYVGDEGNHRIRAIDLAAGTITTVAGNGVQAFSGDGGPATEASLGRPTGVSFKDGLMYIVDTDNNRIRRVQL